jgi:ArsR family transcriptional regulator
MRDPSTNVNACGMLADVPTRTAAVVVRPPASDGLAVLPMAELAACCSPITGGVLDPAAAERLAGVLKALGEPTRLRLVSLIAAHEGAEACVCDLTDPIGLSQPTVSHHLKVLSEAGLIEREQRGKWAYYRLVPGALDALAGMLARATRRR